MATPLAPAWYRFGLLTICLVGICGNALNLLILTRRRLLATLSSVERSSSRTLIAIALADLLFCCAALPAVFYTDEPYVQPAHSVHVLYYKAYGLPLINVFLVSSTYLIVITAVMRYWAVASPFSGRSNCCIRRSGIVSVCVFCLVTLMTLPQFVLYDVVMLTDNSSTAPAMATTAAPVASSNASVSAGVASVATVISRAEGRETRDGDKDEVMYGMQPLFAGADAIDFYLSRIMPVLTSFLPCTLLVIFNVGLIWRLRQAMRNRHQYLVTLRQTASGPGGYSRYPGSVMGQGHGQSGYGGWSSKASTRSSSGGSNSCSRRLTATLVLMFTAHVVLVAPSDVVKYYDALYDLDDSIGDLVSCALNLSLACNFALNFLLFVALNSSFRATLATSLIDCSRRSSSSTSVSVGKMTVGAVQHEMDALRGMRMYRVSGGARHSHQYERSSSRALSLSRMDSQVTMGGGCEPMMRRPRCILTSV